MTRQARALPSGTVTFLFTDLEVSTDLWERHGDAMAVAVRDHDELIGTIVDTHRGVVFKRLGDGAAAAFAVADDAVAAAVDVQRALSQREWDGVGALRARIGIHTGPAEPVGDDYLGPTVNRCARVMAAGHGGQILCSEATHAVARRGGGDVSLRDLGEHRLRGIDEPLRLYQIVAEGLPDRFGALRTEPLAPPVARARTSFVGRQRELELLAEDLVPGAVVTLTGMGGCGKTRLALEAAGTGGRRFDGVHVVELAELTDGGRVLHHVATAVGAPIALSGDPLQAALSVLGQGQRLLVVDNCEHLVDACADAVGRLVAAAPRIAVLVTSREALGVAGERVVRVPSLTDDEAAQLLVERAPPGAVLDPALVAAVCDRLDGIPLAIELAAARLRHLHLAEIARRLDDRFRLLAGGGRGGLRRQQTLRATLDWSHDLLDEGERAVLRRLAVFVGGFDLAAAERVCTGEGVGEADVLDLLGALVDRSLVLFDDADGRYRLLESVRDYGGEQLVAAGEAEGARDRHLAWAVDLLEQHAPIEPDAVTEGPPAAVSGEFENLSAALRWALERGAAAPAYAMAARMLQVWVDRGLFDDADATLSAVAAMPTPQECAREQGAVAIALSEIAAVRGDFALAWERGQAAMALVERSGIDDLSSEAMRSAAIGASVAVDVPTALQLLRASVDAAEATGNLPAAARSLVVLASYLLGAGGLAEASTQLERAAALYDAAPIRRGEVEAFATLAVTRVFGGDVAGAKAALRRSGIDDPGTPWWGGSLFAGAIVAAAAGDADRARSLLRDQLVKTRDLRIPLGESTVLVGRGAVEVLGGDPALGQRLLGAARALFERQRAWRGPIIGGIYREARRRAEELLGPEQARAERDAGLAMSLPEALALVEAAPNPVID